mgnify:CR=1 FL=1
MKKNIPVILIVLLMWGCATDSEKQYSVPGFTLSGEFLFAGPNTLQSSQSFNMEEYTRQMGLDGSTQFSSVVPDQVKVTFNNVEEASQVESILLQVVSDTESMIPIATISPLPEGVSEVDLQVSPETDLLPYLSDTTTVLLADVNLKSDLDDMVINIEMKLNFKYKP